MPDPRTARELMDRFAAGTGLDPDSAAAFPRGAPGPAPRRYLWTDAFAVCNWVGLGQVDRARDLVDRVHRVLGRHRDDDPREGWISGLSEAQGERHPTAGGLRIGKPLPERPPDQPHDPQLEWERDGQYFHYLTRWMRALLRLAAATRDARCHAWAHELARVAFDRFSHGIGPAPNRLHWKMSIDLSRPQVPSMGQHDPLDGYVVMHEIRSARVAAHPDTADASPTTEAATSDLRSRMELLTGMGEASDWITDDPLGAGSLLTDAWFLSGTAELSAAEVRTLERVIRAADVSVQEVRSARLLELPAARRLAFREMGLAIGLSALERLTEAPAVHALSAEAGEAVETLSQAIPMREAITDFWLDPDHRRAGSWLDHDDINTVMLATAVHPAGYLDPAGPERSASG